MNGLMIFLGGWFFGAILLGWALSRWFRFLREPDDDVREADFIRDDAGGAISSSRIDGKNSPK